MRQLIAEHHIFSLEIMLNRGVLNTFMNVKASVEQSHDLLNARAIGETG